MHRISIALCALALTSAAASADSFLGITWSSGKLWDIDSSTGAVSNPRTLSGIGAFPVGITYGATVNDVYTINAGAAGGQFYRIDPSTGVGTFIGSTGITDIFEGDIRYNRTTNTLYALQRFNTNFQLMTINPNTAATTSVNVTGAFPVDLNGLAIDAAGTGFVLDSQGGSLPARLLTIDLISGVVSKTVTLDVVSNSLGGLEFGSDGTLYMLDGTSTNQPNMGLRRVNIDTGATTLMGTSNVIDFSGMALAPVPAPGTVVLGGLVGLSGLRRRR